MKLYAECIMKGIKKQYQDKVREEFVRCYSDIVDENNARFAIWNDLYDMTYGAMFDESHYNRWIAETMQDQIDSKERSKFLVFTVNPDDDIIHAHIKGYEKQTDIYFEFNEA